MKSRYLTKIAIFLSVLSICIIGDVLLFLLCGGAFYLIDRSHETFMAGIYLTVIFGVGLWITQIVYIIYTFINIFTRNEF